jgi:hypothetical protein
MAEDAVTWILVFVRSQALTGLPHCNGRNLSGLLVQVALPVVDRKYRAWGVGFSAWVAFRPPVY